MGGEGRGDWGNYYNKILGDRNGNRSVDFMQEPAEKPLIIQTSHVLISLGSALRVFWLQSSLYQMFTARLQPLASHFSSLLLKYTDTSAAQHTVYSGEEGLCYQMSCAIDQMASEYTTKHLSPPHR